MAYAGFSALVGVTVSSLASEGSMLDEHLWSTVLASLTGLVAALIFATVAEQLFSREVAAEPVAEPPPPPEPVRPPPLRHGVAPRVEIDLAQVAEDVLDTFAYEAETRSIELASVIDPELPAQVYGD